jgi:hypothetical protein
MRIPIIRPLIEDGVLLFAQRCAEILRREEKSKLELAWLELMGGLELALRIREQLLIQVEVSPTVLLILKPELIPLYNAWSLCQPHDPRAKAYLLLKALIVQLEESEAAGVIRFSHSRGQLARAVKQHDAKPNTIDRSVYGQAARGFDEIIETIRLELEMNPSGQVTVLLEETWVVAVRGFAGEQRIRLEREAFAERQAVSKLILLISGVKVV